MKAVTQATLCVLLLSAGCSPQETSLDTDGTWVGTITTEGNVTTVVSESRSGLGWPRQEPTVPA